MTENVPVDLLVVGSVAYDTVETPTETAERILGGSGSFFCSECQSKGALGSLTAPGELCQRMLWWREVLELFPEGLDHPYIVLCVDAHEGCNRLDVRL